MAEEWSTWVPILRVKDAHISAKFYREALGFEVDWEHRFAEGFPLYMQISRPPLHLHLSEHQGGGTSAAEFFVRVPDVDAVHKAMVDRGIEPGCAEYVHEFFGRFANSFVPRRQINGFGPSVL